MTSLVDQGPFAVFAAFVVMHALADFPLQGDYIAKQKSRAQADSFSVWVIALSAHCVIHAGGVWLVSGSLALGIAELGAHALIDGYKGEGKFGMVADQILHLACKVVYTVLLAFGLGIF
ncbi:MAG: DUF3307 domain-containing protein [Luteolibacter sp.]